MTTAEIRLELEHSDIDNIYDAAKIMISRSVSNQVLGYSWHKVSQDTIGLPRAVLSRILEEVHRGS